MKNIGNQIFIGYWISLAVGLGILSKSWETAFSMAVIGTFFIVGSWSFNSVKSKRTVVRRLAITCASVCFLIITAGAISGLERLYLVNAKTYPAWLAKNDLGTLTREQYLNIPECKGMGSEIYEKENGLMVIRCGGIMWYEGHTFVAKIKEL